jgi:hypothetical protein
MKLKPIKWKLPTEKQLYEEFHEIEIEDLLFVDFGHYTRKQIDEAFELMKRHLYIQTIDPKNISWQNKHRYDFKDYNHLRAVVTNYGLPKNPDSLIRSIQQGIPLPCPVFIKKKNGEYLLAGGATRTSIARLANQKVTALVIDEAAIHKIHYKNKYTRLCLMFGESKIRRAIDVINKNKNIKLKDFDNKFPELDRGISFEIWNGIQNLLRFK